MNDTDVPTETAPPPNADKSTADRLKGTPLNRPPLRGRPQNSNGGIFRWIFAAYLGLLLSSLWLGPITAWAIPVGLVGGAVFLVSAAPILSWTHKLRLIDPAFFRSPADARLHGIVAEVATAAGLAKPPKVGVYPSDDLNAFACGAWPGRPLIGVSSALVETLDDDRLRAVIAHETAHITSRDALAMALLEGTVLAIGFVWALPMLILQIGLRLASAESPGLSLMIDGMVRLVRWLGALLIGFLGLVVARAYSRAREFRADAEAARLVGAKAMREALETIARAETERPAAVGALKTYAAFHFAGPLARLAFLGTHPPIERRIAALREMEILPADVAAPESTPSDTPISSP